MALKDENRMEPGQVEGCIHKQTTFVCEVCGRRSGDPEALRQCLNLGPAIDPAHFPVGLIVKAITHNRVSLVQVISTLPVAFGRSHTTRCGWWTFRDISVDGKLIPYSAGDTVDNESCAGPTLHDGWVNDNPTADSYASKIPNGGAVDTSEPAYRRAYNYLLANDITPTVWSKAEGRAITAPEPTDAA